MERKQRGDLEWPTETEKDSQGNLVDVPIAMPPDGVTHHYAPLAIISVAANGSAAFWTRPRSGSAGIRRKRASAIGCNPGERGRASRYTEVRRGMGWPSACTNRIASLSRKIRVRRQKLGLSQEELAHRAGVHPTYLSAIWGSSGEPHIFTPEEWEVYPISQVLKRAVDPDVSLADWIGAATRSKKLS